MKALLTSAGFSSGAFTMRFLAMTGKDAGDIRVVFVPTAAITPDAIAMLPKCMNDLLSAGIPKENVTVYDLHRAMGWAELRAHDAIYFAGGDAEYLMRRINDSGFRNRLLRFIRTNGVYVGVSAGSCVAAENVRRGLKLLAAPIHVHQEKGTRAGPLAVEGRDTVYLTDKQAIIIDGELCEIAE